MNEAQVSSNFVIWGNTSSLATDHLQVPPPQSPQLRMLHLHSQTATVCLKWSVLIQDTVSSSYNLNIIKYKKKKRTDPWQ